MSTKNELRDCWKQLAIELKRCQKRIDAVEQQQREITALTEKKNTLQREREHWQQQLAGFADVYQQLSALCQPVEQAAQIAVVAPPPRVPQRQKSQFRREGQWYICERDGSEMAYIPAGEFWIGADGYSDAPWVKVDLSSYLIDRYPVTNAQYRRFVKDGGYDDEAYWCEDGWQFCQKLSAKLPRYWGNKKFNGDSQPVVGVSWYEASAYCRWAGKQLPTEAQWVKAARGGLVIPAGAVAEDKGVVAEDKGIVAKLRQVFSKAEQQQGAGLVANPSLKRTYPWGDESPNSKRANYRGKTTSPVGQFPAGASPYGCLDMAGNVWEWCHDWYSRDSYQKMADEKDPCGPEHGSARVLLGGSWDYFPGDLVISLRLRYDPDEHIGNEGFRCAGPHL